MQHFEIYLTLDLGLKFLEAVGNIVIYSIVNYKNCSKWHKWLFWSFNREINQVIKFSLNSSKGD